MKNKKGQGPVEIKTQNGTRRLEVRRNKGSTARNSVKTKHNQKSQKKTPKNKKKLGNGLVIDGDHDRKTSSSRGNQKRKKEKRHQKQNKKLGTPKKETR